jgi:hypothetical protein
MAPPKKFNGVIAVLTSLQFHSKHCGFRNLFRGPAIQFSRTERHCSTADDRLQAPPTRRGRASYRCLRFRVKALRSGLIADPQSAGGASCNTGLAGCQAPVVPAPEPGCPGAVCEPWRGSWQTR